MYRPLNIIKNKYYKVQLLELQLIIIFHMTTVPFFLFSKMNLTDFPNDPAQQNVTRATDVTHKVVVL